MSMCPCVTTGAGSSDVPAPCSQQSLAGQPYGLCYYHDQISEGFMQPFFEEAVIKTKAGHTVYSPSKNTTKRKK